MHFKTLLVSLFFGYSALAQVSPLNGYKANLTTKTYVLYDNKTVVTHTDELVVTSDTGRTELSLNRVLFQGAKSNFKLISAYSLTDGKKTEVSPENIKFSDLQSLNAGLANYSQAVIPIENLKVGSTVYLKYQTTDNTIVQGTTSAAVGISNDVLAKEEYYRIESKKNLKFLPIDWNMFFIFKKGVQDGNKFVEIRPTPEAYMSEGKIVKSAKMFATIAPSWESISKQLFPEYNKVVSGTFPAEFQNIVNASKDKTDPKVQIEFVAGEISKIVTYSGDWTTDRKKIFPQNFPTLMNSKKGDCKDYSSAMVSILRKLGFEAYVALTSRTTVYQGIYKIKQLSTFPMLESFNHVIVWAKDKTGKQWWIDPTNPLVFADTLSRDILGNFALVLDNKSKEVTFLPEQNAIKSDTTLEQTLVINPDNLIQGHGEIKFSEASYLGIGMLERMQGSELINKAFNILINPRVKLNLTSKKKAESRVPSYSFDYSGTGFVTEKGSYKGIAISNPISIGLQNIRDDAESYVGELGVTKFVTTVKNASLVEEYQEDCYIRSPWVDIERYVENKEADLVVTDIITIKKKSILERDARSDEFSSFLHDVSSCARSQVITLAKDTKTDVAALDFEKDMGPSVYKMTESDAEALSKLTGPRYFSSVAQKLTKYYYLRLQKNPNDIEALVGIARPTTDLGYRSGDDHEEAYIHQALAYLQKASELSKNSFNAKLIKERAYDNIYLKKYKEASADFALLYSKDSNSFAASLLAGDLASAQESYKLADQWLANATKLAKTDSEKIKAHSRTSYNLMAQEKYLDALPHSQILVDLQPKNAWAAHNLAILYGNLNDLDKAIESEKKAVELDPFPLAKSTLSKYYMMKAMKVGVHYLPDPTVEQKNIFEKHLLDALKADPTSESALFHLGKLYLKSSNADTEVDEAMFQKAKSYEAQLVSLKPDHPLTKTLISLIANAKKPKTAEQANAEVYQRILASPGKYVGVYDPKTGKTRLEEVNKGK